MPIAVNVGLAQGVATVGPGRVVGVALAAGRGAVGMSVTGGLGSLRRLTSDRRPAGQDECHPWGDGHRRPRGGIRFSRWRRGVGVAVPGEKRADRNRASPPTARRAGTPGLRAALSLAL